MRKYSRLMPLFIIQFFTWLGLFSLWIYTVPAITKYVFKTVNAESAEFNSAVQWVGIYFALYSVLGASLTFLLHKILKRHSKYLIHALCLLLGSFGLVSIYFFETKYLLLLSFIFIGVAWSSISTVPYLLVGELAEEGKEEKYFSVFNFSTVIPQAVAAFFLAFLTKNCFSGNTLKTIFAGGILMFIASLVTFGIYLRQRKKILKS